MARDRFFPNKRVFPQNKKDTDTDTEDRQSKRATGRPQEGHRKARGFSPKTGRRRGKLEAGGILYI